jgi:hypothetical protein
MKRLLIFLGLAVGRVAAAPTANADLYTTSEDVPLVVAAPGIFGNDSVEYPKTGLNAVVTGQPANGTVSVASDGSFRYTPRADFSGTETFSYKAIGARDFVIDRARSTVNVRLSVNVTGLGTATDNKNGRVVGNVKALLNPAGAPLQQIQVQDLVTRLDEKMTMRLSWFFGTATISGEIDPFRAGDPDSLVITMDEPGPTVLLGAGGVFAQPGNKFSAVGRAKLSATGLAASLVTIPPTADINLAGVAYDIATVPNEPTLSAPKVVVVGNNLELTIPLKIEQPLVDPAYTGSIIVKGTIVAVAPINPLPETAAVPVTIEVMPADDPPRAFDDVYVTRQNQALAVAAAVVSVEETVVAERGRWWWRTGSDLGTAWREWGYDAGAWASGLGPFGYGDGDEVTLVDDNPVPGYNNNPVPTDRYPTAYFRRDFDVGNLQDTAAMRFELVRDDAAVVYVNGVEVYRDAVAFTAGGMAPLPVFPGAIGYGTTAAAAIPNELESVFTAPVEIPRRLLFEGRNVIGVEVHQAGSGGVVNSSDMSFDGRLKRVRGVSGVLGNDVDPEGNAFLAQLVTGPRNGSVVLNADGSFRYTPAAGFAGTDTFGYRLVQFGVPVVRDVPIVVPGTESVPGSEPLWRYLDTGVDPGATWRSAGFADGAWKEGAAELGYGDGDEKTVVEDNPEPGYSNTPNPGNRYLTTWFRKKVVISNRAGLTALKWRVRRDDGVAVYLNGVRVFTDNLPATFTAATPALGAVADELVYVPFRMTNLASVVEGENVISAEVHQADAGSSDLSFDLGLVAEYGVGGTVTVEVLADDVDSDGISDTWERAHGLGTAENSAAADADGDGQDNRSEFLAGTDPRDARSAMRAVGAERTPGGVRLEFATVAGIRYQLQRSTGLSGWVNEGVVVTATGATTAFSAAVSGGSSGYWRLRCLSTWP